MKDKSWNLHKHFIYKKFVMNFKISGFVGFKGWICNLDFIKVMWHKLGKGEILDSSWELFL